MRHLDHLQACVPVAKGYTLGITRHEGQRARRARGTVVARFLRSAWRSVVCGSLFGYRQLGQC